MIKRRALNPLGRELKSFCGLQDTLLSDQSPTGCSLQADLDERSPSTGLIARKAERHRSFPGRSPSDNPTQFGFDPTWELPETTRPSCETAPMLSQTGLLRAIWDWEALEQRTNQSIRYFPGTEQQVNAIALSVRIYLSPLLLIVACVGKETVRRGSRWTEGRVRGICRGEHVWKCDWS